MAASGATVGAPACDRLPSRMRFCGPIRKSRTFPLCNSALLTNDTSFARSEEISRFICSEAHRAYGDGIGCSSASSGGSSATRSRTLSSARLGSLERAEHRMRTLGLLARGITWVAVTRCWVAWLQQRNARSLVLDHRGGGGRLRPNGEQRSTPSRSCSKDTD